MINLPFLTNLIIVRNKKVAYTDKYRYNNTKEGDTTMTYEQSEKFLFSMFSFTEEENAAMYKQIPMTQELFKSCMDKCMKAGRKADIDFNYLVNEFPEFADGYMEALTKSHNSTKEEGMDFEKL